MFTRKCAYLRVLIPLQVVLTPIEYGPNRPDRIFRLREDHPVFAGVQDIFIGQRSHHSAAFLLSLTERRNTTDVDDGHDGPQRSNPHIDVTIAFGEVLKRPCCYRVIRPRIDCGCALMSAHRSPTLAVLAAIARKVNVCGATSPRSISSHVHGADTGAPGLARTAYAAANVAL